MKGESFILGELALAMQRATPESGDSEITIPSTVLPIVELSRSFRAGSADQPFTNTFAATGAIRVINGAATAADLCQIGKGLWRLYLSFAYHSNYTSTGATLSDAGWGLAQNALRTDQALWYANTNLSQNKHITIVVNLPATTIVQYFLSANGAAQEHRLNASIIGELLI